MSPVGRSQYRGPSFDGVSRDYIFALGLSKRFPNTATSSSSFLKLGSASDLIARIRSVTGSQHLRIVPNIQHKLRLPTVFIMSLDDLGDRVVMASVREVIHAPANEIWPFLSAIGAERLLIPGCTKSVLVEGYGKGALRRIYFGDTAFDERILECDSSNYKLKYEVMEPSASPANGVLAAVQLVQTGPNETVITWVSGAKSLPSEHEASLIEQGVGFCHGQIASLRKLVRATTESF